MIWNTVFDARIVKGARDYVDRQQVFAEGRGPRVDMGQEMDDARRAGLRAAWLWSGLELAAGAALAAGVAFRTGRRARASTPGASR